MLFLGNGQQHTQRHAFRCLGDFLEAREARCDADVAVARVLAQREGGAGRGQHDAGLLGQLHHAAGQAIGHVEADEVAAGRLRPGCHAPLAEFLLEHFDDLVELGLEDGGVLLHQRLQAVLVAQEAHMAQLVDLVRADGALVHARQQPLHVGGRAAEHGDAGAGQRDLGGRGEHIGAVRVAVLGAQLDDVGDGGCFAVQVVDRVGVVPEQAEVAGGRLHPGQALDHGVGVDRAGRVAVLRYAPHALDARVVGDQMLDLVHVRAIVVQCHRDQLDAEFLADGEVAVIAGHRAEEGGSGRLPRRAVGRALEQCEGDAVVHQRQARIVADDDVVGADAEHRCEQLARFGDALQVAVVAAVFLVRCGVVAGARQRQQFLRQVELVRRRLAARHVQRETGGLQGGVAGLQLLAQRAQLVHSGRGSGHVSLLS